MRRSQYILSDGEFTSITTWLHDALIDLRNFDDDYHKTSAELRIERALKMLYGEEEYSKEVLD